MGLDYRRVITRRWAVGALFDYAEGDLRNSVVAASVTWLPVGRLALTAAPGVEFHEGRGGLTPPSVAARFQKTTNPTRR